MNVYLDDCRLPHMSHNIGKGLGLSYSEKERWIIVRNFFEFTRLIENHFDYIDLISFDHDLSCFQNNIEYTGKSAVDYIIKYCLDTGKKFPNWYVHTDNTTGRVNMIGTILNFLEKVEKKDISKFRYYNNGIINGRLV